SAQQDFDLMLSDLGLPDGTGLDLLREMRAHGLALPAIALSGYGQDVDIQQSRAVGFFAHLTKPVSISKLQQTMAKFIEDCSRPEDGK
ncbi:MAG: response regulator, partial [Phycisphaerae bacterium]